jgi:hypothetical protein
MNELLKTTAGRLLALSFAISLLAGGVSALMPHGSPSTFLFCAAVFVPVMIAVVGMVGLMYSDWYHAILSTILLPGLFVLWSVGLGVIREYNLHALAGAALVLGLVPLFFVVRPTHHYSMRLAHQH